jgi:uncharacterized membrane protein YfcA
MTLAQAAILFVAAFLGGALNSVAGGGSFIAFPALVYTGVPDISANATNTIALWPGSVASVGAYRRDLAGQRRLFWLGGISLIGGIFGAVLLLRTPPAVFRGLIPFLLLFAVLLFTFGGHITRALRKRLARGEAPVAAVDDPNTGQPSWGTVIGISLVMLVIAVYGGYFGGGIGIMILATLAVVGMENIHTMNGIKTVLQSCINGVAVLTFVVGGAIVWPQALVMVCGAIVGGYGGAYYARKLDPTSVRRFVIFIGFLMTAYFFYRYYVIPPA